MKLQLFALILLLACVVEGKKKNGCRRDGKVFEEGDVVPHNNKCKTCECVLEDGRYRVNCEHTKKCPDLDCSETIEVNGECCPRCKDDPVTTTEKPDTTTERPPSPTTGKTTTTTSGPAN